MATIITVHGTNASGPRERDKWWQVGGSFQQDLKRWVKPDKRDLVFEQARLHNLE